MAPKRRRSEGGPQLVWRRVRGRMESGVLTWNAIQSEPVQVVSRAVRALLELPKEIVEQILRLTNWRYLEYNPYGRSYFIQERGWAGTHRMVNFNRVQWTGDLFMRQPDGGLPSWIELAQALTGP